MLIICQATTVHAHPKSAADSEMTVTCQSAGSAGDSSALCAEARLLALSHHNMIAPSKVKHKSHEAQNNLSSTLSLSVMSVKTLRDRTLLSQMRDVTRTNWQHTYALPLIRVGRERRNSHLERFVHSF